MLVVVAPSCRTVSVVSRLFSGCLRRRHCRHVVNTHIFSIKLAKGLRTDNSGDSLLCISCRPPAGKVGVGLRWRLIWLIDGLPLAQINVASTPGMRAPAPVSLSPGVIDGSRLLSAVPSANQLSSVTHER